MSHLAAVLTVFVGRIHLVPIECGGFQCRQGGVVGSLRIVGGIGWDCGGCGRGPAVVIHHLGKARDGAARGAVLATHDGRQAVVGFCLVPLALQQRCDAGLGGMTASGTSLAGLTMICAHAGACHIIVEPRAHVGRHALWIKCAVVAVADDCVGLVAGTHQHKALVIAHVHGIGHRLLVTAHDTGLRCRSDGLGFVASHGALSHKLHSSLPGLLRRDGRCGRSQAGHGAHE